jgi:hypothetical protein
LIPGQERDPFSSLGIQVARRFAMLQPCPECKNSVSGTAESCPHCGYRLRGRENLVHCPRCKTEVLPEISPHDTISRYCPLCKQPVTNLSGRKVFFVASGMILAAMIALAILIWNFSKTFKLP